MDYVLSPSCEGYERSWEGEVNYFVNSLIAPIGIVMFLTSCDELELRKYNACRSPEHRLTNEQLLSIARANYIPKIGRERALECVPYEDVAAFDRKNPGCC